MRTQILEGSLEEQCDYLYEQALRKLEEGNYTGALYIFKDIVAHQPDYKDAAHLLDETRRYKSEQRFLLLSGVAGAALFVGIGSVLQVANDLYFLLLCVIGAIFGYIVGRILRRILYQNDSALHNQQAAKKRVNGSDKRIVDGRVL